jgi:hypothetical protein
MVAFVQTFLGLSFANIFSLKIATPYFHVPVDNFSKAINTS